METQPQPNIIVERQPAAPEKGNKVAEFEPGQIVVVKSSPSSRGAVIAVLLGHPENRFQPFIDNSTQTFYSCPHVAGAA